MSSCLIGSILICIVGITTAFGADVPAPNSTAVKKSTESKESVVTVETVAGKDLKAVRLYPLDQIPDSAEIREAITASWFSAPIEKVIKKAPELHTDSKEIRLRYRGSMRKTVGIFTLSLLFPILLITVSRSTILYRKVHGYCTEGLIPGLPYRSRYTRAKILLFRFLSDLRVKKLTAANRLSIYVFLMRMCERILP